MQSKYNTVIFDYSNVLTTEGQSNPMSAYIAKIIQIDKNTVKQAFKEVEDPYVIGNITGEEFIKRILNRLNIVLDEQQIQKLKPALTTTPDIEQNLLEYIRDLHNRVITILFSDNFKEMSDYIINEYKLNQLFHHLFFSNHIKLRKPDFAFYKYLVDKTKIDPRKAIFIDDREVNLLPANKLGIKTILHTSVEDTIKRIDQLLN